MRIFIDANIYLKFYDLKEEWSHFDRLKSLIPEKAQLLFPEITFNEVVRNIYGENFLSKDSRKIENCIVITPDTKSVKGLGLKEEDIENIRKEVEAYKNDKILKFKKDRLEHAKQYVKKIEALREIALPSKETEELVGAAHIRQLLGNPPSKRSDPIGDNLVWEIILKIYNNDDIFIVAVDPDWRRDNFSYALHPILEREWKKASGNKSITLVPSLGELISKIDPKHPVSEKVIGKEKETPSVQIPIPPYYYPPVGTVTVVEPIMPFSGSAYFGDATTPSIGHRNPCQQCGNSVDNPNIYYLCNNCLRGRTGSY